MVQSEGKKKLGWKSCCHWESKSWLDNQQDLNSSGLGEEMGGALPEGKAEEANSCRGDGETPEAAKDPGIRKDSGGKPRAGVRPLASQEVGRNLRLQQSQVWLGKSCHRRKNRAGELPGSDPALPTKNPGRLRGGGGVETGKAHWCRSGHRAEYCMI